MTDYRLTHPNRPTLEFRQAQRDEDVNQTIADITKEIGVDRPALVHTRSREETRTLEGRVTAPRRTAFDADTDDWQQALANYIMELESHVDEFQGEPGYTFEDDRRNQTRTAVLRGVTWKLLGGQPYEVEYEIDLHVGEGVLEDRSITIPDVTVNTGMDVAATVDGEPLPGLRRMVVTRELEFEINPRYGWGSAEGNELVVKTGVEHRIEFHGTHTGSQSARAMADDELESLVGKSGIDFVTRFPGYTLTGTVLKYRPERTASFGGSTNQYVLEFIEGRDVTNTTGSGVI